MLAMICNTSLDYIYIYIVIKVLLGERVLRFILYIFLGVYLALL